MIKIYDGQPFQSDEDPIQKVRLFIKFPFFLEQQGAHIDHPSKHQPELI